MCVSILGPEPDHQVGDNDASVIQMSTKTKASPDGVVVALICNIDSIGMSQLALEIAKNFEALKFENNAYNVRKVFLC